MAPTTRSKQGSSAEKRLASQSVVKGRENANMWTVRETMQSLFSHEHRILATYLNDFDNPEWSWEKELDKMVPWSNWHHNADFMAFKERWMKSMSMNGKIRDEWRESTITLDDRLYNALREWAKREHPETFADDLQSKISSPVTLLHCTWYKFFESLPADCNDMVALEMHATPPGSDNEGNGFWDHYPNWLAWQHPATFRDWKAMGCDKKKPAKIHSRMSMWRNFFSYCATADHADTRDQIDPKVLHIDVEDAIDLEEQLGENVQAALKAVKSAPISNEERAALVTKLWSDYHTRADKVFELV